MAGERVSATRGRHALRSRAFADELVREAGVAPGDLVLDLGAGAGLLTGALRAAGARVLAVELDRALGSTLRSRFGRDDNVRIVEGDATRITLPAEPFAVLSNLPFASGTAILRRLLDDPRVPLTRLDVIVEWGLAEKRSRVWPSTQLSCYWSAWYELAIARRVPREAFVPPPAVDAALLRAVRREEPLVPVDDAQRYLAFLQRGFAEPGRLRRVVPRTALRRVAFANDASARDLDARQWAALYRALN
ncbi:MAG TPA: rRNA adenine N(6)-methyltransferase family protein [Gaiellaceae bacterium]|nr:rRNA adenine N(6)-methyltransferase family protein [Gaiellaceae bacterium]